MFGLAFKDLTVNHIDGKLAMVDFIISNKRLDDVERGRTGRAKYFHNVSIESRIQLDIIDIEGVFDVHV